MDTLNLMLNAWLTTIGQILAFWIIVFAVVLAIKIAVESIVWLFQTLDRTLFPKK